MKEGADRHLQEFVGLHMPGKIRLFHYSDRASVREADRMVVDPKYFESARGSYSRQEYTRSTFPRSFYYTDIKHKEGLINKFLGKK